MKKIMKKVMGVILAAALLLSVAACDTGGAGAGTAAAGFPTRDINIVVPWGAGGITDIAVRSLAELMHEPIGVNMPILNMGGASGSIGLQDVFNSPRDGYRILATSLQSLSSVSILDFSEVTPGEWYTWTAVHSPNVIAVRADSEFETLTDLINAMAASPGTITIGTAGPGSSGHLGAVVLTGAADVTFNHIPYDGSAPAVIAVLSGEVMLTTQLLVDKIDYIRAGELRALATMSDETIELVGVDGQTIAIPSAKEEIPALADWLPWGSDIGLMVPRDTPSEVLSAFDAAFNSAVHSDAFAEFSAGRGFVVWGMNRADSDAFIEGLSAKIAWTLYDAGLAVNSPVDFGLPRP